MLTRSFHIILMTSLIALPPAHAQTAAQRPTAEFKPPAESAIPAGPQGEAIRNGKLLLTETHQRLPANVGNKLLAAMKLRLLLDYRGKTMTFYGDCP